MMSMTTSGIDISEASWSYFYEDDYVFSTTGDNKWWLRCEET